MAKCYWCWAPPPCAHAKETETGLDELRHLVKAHQPVYPTRLEQLKIKWVRWFHAPADDTRKWCNCGRPYPCRTRLDVLLD